MDYIRKTLIVSFIFSIFFLATLQVNRIINNSKKNVLGATTGYNSTFCNILSSLTDKYCPNVITSPTLPVINVGQTTRDSDLGQTSVSNNPTLITNISVSLGSDGKTATITFTLSEPNSARIEYGTTAASLVLMSASTIRTNTHQIFLSSLRPGTSYYYRIKVGDKTFDNNGIPYFFITKNQAIENKIENSLLISNVRATPGSDGKSATIIFTSSEPSVAKVEYGITAASLVLMSAESSMTTDHRILLSYLRSGTSYYYRIRIRDKVFDNNGTPFVFITK